MKKSYIFILFLAVIITACTEKVQKETIAEEGKEEISNENLAGKLTLTYDSLNSVWQEMIVSDNQKFDDIRRLLLEASYTQSYNPIALEDLQKRTNDLQASRYVQDSMTSEQIDTYDQLSVELLKAIFSFVQQTPDLQHHSITNQLVTSIQDADNEVIYFRVKYDRWTKDFNQLVVSYQDQLQQMGEPYSSFKSKPIFSLEL